MRPHMDLLTRVRARRRPQHQVKHILGIYAQARDLGAARLQRFRYAPNLGAVPVHAEGPALRRRTVDLLPLQHHARLRRVPHPQRRRRRRPPPKRVENRVLQPRKGVFGALLGRVVARHRHVDDAAARDVGREKHRGELDLRWVGC